MREPATSFRLLADAYVDHPASNGHCLNAEAQGFRVGIIPPSQTPAAKTNSRVLGKLNPSFGVTAGNMDSMMSVTPADRRLRHDDAYTPDNVSVGSRPHCATLVYTQRLKEAWKDVPVIPRRYQVSCAVPYIMINLSIPCAVPCWWYSKADTLMFGNGERPLVEAAHRLAMGEPITASLMERR
ncbi:hypothetical protein ACNKHU_18600 [Shigella flexneri]